MKNKTGFIVLFSALILLSTCLSDMCGSTVIKESVSPNQKYIATVFEWGCGATTSFNRVVNLRYYGSEFDGADQDDWIYSLEGQLEVNMEWVSENELKVFYPAGAAPNIENTWHDVRISFQKQ